MIVGIKVRSDGSKGENSCHVFRERERERVVVEKWS